MPSIDLFLRLALDVILRFLGSNVIFQMIKPVSYRVYFGFPVSTMIEMIIDCYGHFQYIYFTCSLLSLL